MSPVDWGSWGQHYLSPAGALAGGAIIELVRIWEGEESAAIAARWLDRQPEVTLCRLVVDRSDYQSPLADAERRPDRDPAEAADHLAPLGRRRSQILD